MKLHLSCLIVALVAFNAEARLLDYESGLVERYGTPLETNISHNFPDAKEFVFKVGAFNITCTTIQGRTEEISYNNGGLLTIEEIEGILSLNIQRPWSPTTRGDGWGGFKTSMGEYASYSTMSGVTFLTITTINGTLIKDKQRRKAEELKKTEKLQNLGL